MNVDTQNLRRVALASAGVVGVLQTATAVMALRRGGAITRTGCEGRVWPRSR